MVYILFSICCMVEVVHTAFPVKNISSIFSQYMSNYIGNLIDGAENTFECMEHYAELVGFSNQEKNHSPAVEP